MNEDYIMKIIDDSNEKNSEEHASMNNKIKELSGSIKDTNINLASMISFSKTQGILLRIAGAILLFLVGIIAQYSRLSYRDTKTAFEFNKETYKIMLQYKDQLDHIYNKLYSQEEKVVIVSDTLAKTIKDINTFYFSEWIPRVSQIEDNSRRINIIEKKIIN